MGYQKYKIVSELLKETMREVSSGEESWCRFLATSSRLYKYPFKEQVLIYAQRPDATACASVDIWNHRMNCWINRGAKGIALVDEDRRGKLKYVFDVSDVHKGRWRGRLPYLWDMKNVHQEVVLKRLEELYGKTDENASFVDRIRVIADRVTEETGRQLFYDVAEFKKGSRLEHLDDANLKLRLQITLSDSVAYSILKRCGISDEVLENTIGFMYIREFNTTDTLLLLGNHVAELAKPVLMEICRCIWTFDKEQEKAQKQQRQKSAGREHEKAAVPQQNENQARTALEEMESGGKTGPGFGKTVEMLLEEADSIKARKEAEKNARGESSADMVKKSNLGLANRLKAHYNALKRESNNETENTAQESASGGERSQNGETGIRTERGLHDTDASDGRGAGGNGDEIRTDEGNLPQGAQERSLHTVSAEGRTEGTSSEDSGTGRGENGSPDRTDGEGGGRERAAQGGEPDAVGTEDEQHPSFSGGDRSEGTDLQLNNDVPVETYEQLSLFPSFGEQVGTVAAAEADTVHVMPAAFSLSKEQTVEILRSGGGRRDSRKRIYAKYQQGKSPEEITEFLKNEYGTTGKGFIFDDNPVVVWFDESGMRAGFGTSAIESTFLRMNWQNVERHIRDMINDGSYMSAAEAFLVDESERLRVANDIYYFFRDGVPDLWEVSEYRKNTVPESVAELCSLLADNNGRQELLAQIKEAEELLKLGVIKKKWNYVKSPQYLIEQIEDMGREKVSYPCTDHVEVRNEDFITRDEIDHRLAGGSNIQHGKFRIYEYFTEMHEQYERVAFLKNEYGIGGSSHALPGSDYGHENHDAKGIKLEKGSYLEPYAEVLLNWNFVEKRIRKLINEGKYLRGNEFSEYLNYRQEKAQKAELKKLQAEQQQSSDTENVEIPKDVQDKEAEAYMPNVDVPETESESEPKRYEVVLTSDAFEEPFAVWDNQEDDYYVLDGIVQTFETEAEATAFCDSLNAQINADLIRLPELSDNGISNNNKLSAVNFRITPETEISAKGFSPKEKFRQNVEAIRTLKSIEAEHRTATPEEQEILSRYAGWGGLSDAFDSGKANWHTEYQELKNLLSPEEYASARESTLNAHYTSPAIIQSIYDVIDGMGFSQGTILEPAMGTGHFFGMLPEQMQQSRLYGVELDSLSGRIAKQLYPNASIQISGFEKTDFPDNFFDIAIGNVPFGQYKVSDRGYDKYNLSVHDYFLIKSLDKVKPGGIVAFITSKSTMDKRNPSARKLMAQRGELIGAVRLPNTAFKENAGTEVTSDILFFRKHERMLDLEPDWVHLSENENGIVMNSYFTEHPEMILGRMEMISGPYGKEAACLPNLSVPLSEQLKKAGEYITGRTNAAGRNFIDVENNEMQIETAGVSSNTIPNLTEIGNMDVLPVADRTALESSITMSAFSELPTDPNVKNYSYAIVDSRVYYRENSIMKLMELPETTKERIKAMVQLRDCTQELIELQMEDFPDTLIQGAQAQLY